MLHFTILFDLKIISAKPMINSLMLTLLSNIQSLKNLSLPAKTPKHDNILIISYFPCRWTQHCNMSWNTILVLTLFLLLQRNLSMRVTNGSDLLLGDHNITILQSQSYNLKSYNHNLTILQSLLHQEPDLAGEAVLRLLTGEKFQ